MPDTHFIDMDYNPDTTIRSVLDAADQHGLTLRYFVANGAANGNPNCILSGTRDGLVGFLKAFFFGLDEAGQIASACSFVDEGDYVLMTCKYPAANRDPDEWAWSEAMIYEIGRLPAKAVG